MTCLSRAASALETDGPYQSGDDIAPLLLPGLLKPLLHLSPVRKFITRIVAPKGIYEYVIARTKYLDAVFARALSEQFGQILIFGAGFDTRALRFQDRSQNTRVFELDIPATQQAKIRQYQKRGLAVPSNLLFIAIDFDRESLPSRLEAAGFRKHERSLFLLEGLLMYLRPESVQATFQTIRDYAGAKSLVAFDYVYASVLRKEGLYHGESGIVKTVSGAGEPWRFGLEPGAIGPFLAGYDFRLIDHKDAAELEQVYFSDPDGVVVGNINGTHCLVTAEKA